MIAVRRALQSIRTSNVKTHCYLQGEGMNTKTYEVLRIMRTRLRQTLLSKVPTDWLQFGKTCMSVEPPLQTGQPVKLQFSDGSSAECDLLVVADGANSKLRNHLIPREKIRYAGVTMLFVSRSQYQTLEKSFANCFWDYLTADMPIGGIYTPRLSHLQMQ